MGLDGSVYRLKIDFPFRVFTNCGQDSILRPVIGKNGIPFIPGSSIKGLFRRLLWNNQVSQESKDKIEHYCGSQEKEKPGILRFHGAYPVGDWAGTNTVIFQRQGVEVTETRYRVIDVVHPQQKRQVQGEMNTTASATVSLYEPTIIFELSSSKKLTEEDWKSIAGLLKTALRSGLGGKTSSGYGLCFIPQNQYPLNIHLQGTGVSSLLRSNEPEFRPNLFKASLRSHVSRLLAGVCNSQETVNLKVEKLFGSTTDIGVVKIYWESKSFNLGTQGTEKTPIYQVTGNLYIDAPKEDLELIKLAIEFAYTMGGFGKSWRRVWHKGSGVNWHPGFYPQYQTRAIGCHWECLDWDCSDSNLDRTTIQNGKDLSKFLNNLHNYCKSYMGLSQNSNQHLAWKEAWHPNNVKVYSRVVSNLKNIKNVIDLFHDEIFKTTPAIGGKKIVKKEGKDKEQLEFVISNVWHRVLPLENNQYLEIVTIFRHDSSKSNWMRQGQDQFESFIKAITKQGLKLTWPNNS